MDICAEEQKPQVAATAVTAEEKAIQPASHPASQLVLMIPPCALSSSMLSYHVAVQGCRGCYDVMLMRGGGGSAGEISQIKSAYHVTRHVIGGEASLGDVSAAIRCQSGVVPLSAAGMSRLLVKYLVITRQLQLSVSDRVWNVSKPLHIWYRYVWNGCIEKPPLLCRFLSSMRLSFIFQLSTFSVLPLLGGLHHGVHERDVVIFGDLAVLLRIGPVVFGHGHQQVINQFIWDQRVSQVQFRDVWL